MPIWSFSSYLQLKWNFSPSIISRAFSGSPSFFVRGKTASFTGARAAGRCSTVRVSPLGSFSSSYEWHMMDRNIRSTPMDVSMTYGV